MIERKSTKTWVKPGLSLLGKLADVANGQFPGPQGGATKS